MNNLPISKGKVYNLSNKVFTVLDTHVDTKGDITISIDSLGKRDTIFLVEDDDCRYMSIDDFTKRVFEVK